MSQLLHKPEACFFQTKPVLFREPARYPSCYTSAFFPNQTCNVERARQMSQLLHKPEASRHHLVELVTGVPVRYGYIITTYCEDNFVALLETVQGGTCLVHMYIFLLYT